MTDSRPTRLVELLTKPDCSLCERMKAVLASAAAGLDVEIREIDVSRDPILAARYAHRVPLLRIDGDEAFQYRATERELRRRLRQR